MQLRVLILGLLAACGLVLAAGQAQAVSYGYDFTGPDWNSSDFSLVGSALWVNDGGVSPATRLRLTDNSGGDVGDAWLNTGAVDASAAWSAEFTYQISYEGNGGADGLGFHLHENGLGANTFFNGSGLSGPSLSIGIDTWNNSGEGDFVLEVFNNGGQVGGNVNLNPLGPIPDDVYQVVMVYNGAGTLSVNVINTANSNQTGPLNYAVNLTNLDNAVLGWSANTGGAAENHDIRTFSATFVPEPGTAVLLGTALAGLGWHRRRA